MPMTDSLSTSETSGNFQLITLCNIKEDIHLLPPPEISPLQIYSTFKNECM
jgi:hypothetical protein